MKSKILFRMMLSRVLLGSLCLMLIPSHAFAQQKTGSATKLQVSLGILIDTSAHQKKVIEFERQAIRAIVDSFAGVATESFIIRYADEVETLRDWALLEPGLGEVSRRIELDVESGTNRRTLLNDALSVALSKLETRNNGNSRVLIVVAEGNDAGSLARYAEVKKRAKSAHVQCFALLVASHNLIGGRARHFGYDLYDLASATKGRAYDVEDSRKNLGNALRDLLKRVRSLSEKGIRPLDEG